MNSPKPTWSGEVEDFGGRRWLVEEFRTESAGLTRPLLIRPAGQPTAEPRHVSMNAGWRGLASSPSEWDVFDDDDRRDKLARLVKQSVGADRVAALLAASPDYKQIIDAPLPLLDEWPALLHSVFVGDVALAGALVAAGANVKTETVVWLFPPLTSSPLALALLRLDAQMLRVLLVSDSLTQEEVDECQTHVTGRAEHSVFVTEYDVNKVLMAFNAAHDIRVERGISVPQTVTSERLPENRPEADQASHQLGAKNKTGPKR